MTEKLKIKLSIADRMYPLTIDPVQEEGLRKAARAIDELVKKFEQNYAVRDKQDVLAMCALQMASQAEKLCGQNKEQVSEYEQFIKDMDEALNNAASK